MEYRPVSVRCSFPHLPASVIWPICRYFPFGASAFRHVLKTFNPKVAGSIPARPMEEMPAAPCFTCGHARLGHASSRGLATRSPPARIS